MFTVAMVTEKLVLDADNDCSEWLFWRYANFIVWI